MNKVFATTLFLFATLLALVGCGGGGGGHKTSVNASAVKFSLGWGERTRVTQGPSSALSATLTLTGATASGADLVFTVNRTADLGAYTGNYTTDVAAKKGSHPLTIRFYSAAGGTGTVVAQGSATVVIASDGTGVGTITVANTVASVELTAGQTIPSGTQLQLAFTAKDASGNVVAVSPGSAKFTQTSGTGFFTLTGDGVATATAAGSGNVQVTVDGVSSPAVAVTVTPVIVASVVVDAGQTLVAGTSRQLTFTAKDAQGNVLAIPPSSSSWTVFDGGSSISLTTTGVATASLAGTAHVRVTVGGITSVATAVTVTPGSIASVTVTANQSVAIGQSKQLIAVAKDAQGNVVSGGTIVWSNVDSDPDLSLTTAGVATGLQTGTAAVTASVGGVTSVRTIVTITP